METGIVPPGAVRSMPLSDLKNPTAGHSASAHDTSLLTALRAAQAVDADIPSRVDVVSIEAKTSYDFSEQLSPEISAAVPVATQEVLKLLDQDWAPAG